MYKSSKRRLLIAVLLAAWTTLFAYSKISPDFPKELLTPVLAMKK
jgi:hypothetical protein